MPVVTSLPGLFVSIPTRHESLNDIKADIKMIKPITIRMAPISFPPIELISCISRGDGKIRKPRSRAYRSISAIHINSPIKKIGSRIRCIPLLPMPIVIGLIFFLNRK